MSGDNASDRVAFEAGLVEGAARLETTRPDHAIVKRGDDVWSVALVKARLSEAAQVIEATVREDRPGFRSGAWPSYEPEFGTFAQWVQKIQTGDYEDEQARQNRGRAPPPSKQMIARAEEALQWPWRYLSGPDEYEELSLLKLWMFAEAKGLFWEETLEHVGQPKRSANRRRRSAFEIIMAGLLADGIAP